MNEPRVIESVTNECQSLGRAHESSSARVEQLISCLEGEIAKRDEELAACRVSVENCEAFRARIAELEAKTSTAIGVGSGSGNLFVYGNYDSIKAAQKIVIERDQLRAELSALKAQDTVGEVVGWYRLDRPYEMTSYPSVCATWHRLGAPVAPLYAAPVSEAKARGVVMPDTEDFCFCGKHVSLQMISGGASNHGYLGSVTLLIDGEYVEYTRLNAAPAAPAADAGIVDMYRHLQKVTPYRFKKIQDASITDGGDVMYFHKDRFDAALLADMAAHCATKGVV